MTDFKVFNDTVHGYMDFHPLIVIFADTMPIQRLRNIKQLGVCYFVFPSACHNRFEHSLGTAHLAGKLFDSLREKGIPGEVSDPDDWKKMKLCVQIAGLCHDVGHGPFSHAWEKFRKRANPNLPWSHEKESVKILDLIMKEPVSPTKKINGMEFKCVRDAFEYCGLSDVDLKTIKTMILGQKNPKHYIFQIINNKNTGIDVDKWDYLARDSAMLNMPIAFDYRRLLNYCCVLPNKKEGQICFREKECSVLVEMFLARGRLHDKAYQHIKVKIIEEMLIDAFLFANERLDLIWTPITELTDHIYQRILLEDFGPDKNMHQAKRILRRIESRNLYLCIARESFKGDTFDEEKIYSRLRASPDLHPYIDEISVSFIKLDMTKSNKKVPLKNVLVYKREKGQIPNCTEFKWDEYQDTLKFNVENLKRYQVLLLYKGEKKFPNELKHLAREKLKEICYL